MTRRDFMIRLFTVAGLTALVFKASARLRAVAAAPSPRIDVPGKFFSDHTGFQDDRE